MRVAFSGAHRTGKTTLIDALSNALPAYEVIDEPYRVLEEAGYEFSDPPSIEDFEQQLRTSIELVAAAPSNALIDRCPLDFVAYLHALGEDVELADLRDTIARLDLIVFVPIEARIAVPDHEDLRLRRRVDERLQQLVGDVDTAVIEVAGVLDERVRQVMRAIEP